MPSQGSRTYVYKGDPKTGKSRPLQDIVMEKVLGRPLRKGEQVDHIDSNPHNNRPSNLRVMSAHDNEHLGGEHAAAKTNAKRGRNKSASKPKQ